MPRGRRLGRILLWGALGVVALNTQARAARDGIREFPHTVKCPGTAFADNRVLEFTSNGSSATLTFLTHNKQLVRDDLGNVLREIDVSISLDHVMVVEKTVFNAYREAYPAEGLEAYGVAVWKDSSHTDPACYFDAEVGSLFRRFDPRLKAGTKAWPFYDNFDGPGPAWTLINSSIGLETLDLSSTQSPSLILSRQVKQGPDTQYSASVRVNNLIKTRTYVVDFSWFVTGSFDAGDVLMTVDLQ